jgi:hypothetical protein
VVDRRDDELCLTIEGDRDDALVRLFGDVCVRTIAKGNVNDRLLIMRCVGLFANRNGS